MPKYYPIMLDVRDRPAIVIGGDRLAAEKATNLLACGARVTAINPTFDDEFHTLAEQHGVILQTKSYEPSDLTGAFVVVAVTSKPQLIEAIWHDTQQRGQLVNIVDVPARCNFILPSILRRGQLTIAVSTEGASPSLAKRIRQQLEGIFPSAYDMYMQLATIARTRMRMQGIAYDQRDNFFSDYFTSDMLTLLSEGQVAEAIIATAELLQRHGVTITAETITRDLREAATSHDSYTTA